MDKCSCDAEDLNIFLSGFSALFVSLFMMISELHLIPEEPGDLPNLVLSLFGFSHNHHVPELLFQDWLHYVLIASSFFVWSTICSQIA